ncbi:NRDE family protein [Luedemannella flava]
MCTVLLRLDPAAAWPLLLLAVRDEYLGRPWDRPGRHWPALGGRLVGGRDSVSGGTWLAVDPAAPAVAAVLNGDRLPVPAAGARPTRGGCRWPYSRGHSILPGCCRTSRGGPGTTGSTCCTRRPPARGSGRGTAPTWSSGSCRRATTWW